MWYSRSYETNSTDNSLTTTMHVKRDDYVLGIETVPANGQYKEGVTVVTSYLISNDSERDLIPGTGADAEFKVYYYNGSQKIILHSQIRRKRLACSRHGRWQDLHDGRSGTGDEASGLVS